MAETNGTTEVAVSREAIDELLLGPPLTAGYKPQIPANNFWNQDGTPNFTIMRDIEVMLTHPEVFFSLDMYKSGIGNAKVKVKTASSPQVKEFAQKEIDNFLSRGLPMVQGSYDFGWGGSEVMYEVDQGGRRAFASLLEFHPRDVNVLTRDGNDEYMGVQVKSVPGGPINLWGPRRTGAMRNRSGYDIPAKGFWYAHKARWNKWYGMTQLFSAWRPWQRLAGQDGAETVCDGGIYRFAYAGPIVRYPLENFRQTMPGQVCTEGTAQPARDHAREMGASVKAGASIGLPSSRYPTEQGGGYKWELEWPKHVLAVDPILNYIRYLKNEIRLGIGVAPELIEAANVGSGYSGRAIPMEGYLMGQQRNINSIVAEWKWQIGNPTVKYNFGPDAWFEVEVESLLETKTRSVAGLLSEGRAALPDSAKSTEEQSDAVGSLRATVGGSQAIAALQKDYYSGQTTREAAIANAILVFGFDKDEADKLFPPQDIKPQKLTEESNPAGAGGPAVDQLLGM